MNLDGSIDAVLVYVGTFLNDFSIRVRAPFFKQSRHVTCRLNEAFKRQCTSKILFPIPYFAF